MWVSLQYVETSTSTVGLPLESRISLAYTCSISKTKISPINECIRIYLSLDAFFLKIKKG
jgi:hypothetical protein